jgi:YD repeat-containing protein
MAGGTAATPSLTTIRYSDASGRLMAVMLPDNDGDGSFATGQNVYRYTYDIYGNQTSQADSLNRTTGFAYDVFGRRTSRTLPMGQSESWTYDTLGRLGTHEDFKDQSTQYVYDETAAQGGRIGPHAD